MYDLSQVVVTSSPHLHTEEDTRSIMLDVIIAMLPALAIAVFTFGWRSLTLTVVSVVFSVLAEYVYRRILKKPNSIGDLSAVVTGMLLAFNLPVSVPLWMPALGAVFAIVVAKCLFGGIGKNFINPALAGRAFLMASFSGMMNRFVAPQATTTSLPLFSNVSADVVSTATPLSQMRQLADGGVPSEALASFRDLFMGNIGGCLGEVSACALIIGALYLFYRRVITPRIPLAYLGTVALLTLLFPQGNLDGVEWMLMNLLSGGLMLGAIFMATDYTTTPVTAKGQIIFGIGCGLLTVLIRYFGAFNEGVSYAILIMNATVGLLDKVTRPRKYGAPRRAKGKKKEAVADEN